MTPEQEEELDDILFNLNWADTTTEIEKYSVKVFEFVRRCEQQAEDAAWRDARDGAQADYGYEITYTFDDIDDWRESRKLKEGEK